MIRGTDPKVQERLAAQVGFGFTGQNQQRSQELLRALGAVDAAYEEHFEALGISDARVRLLSLLHPIKTGLEPSQIAERLGMSRAAVTSLVNGHEKAGYVTRVETMGALRGFTVQITERGEDLLIDFHAQHARRMAAVANALTPKEHKALLELLAKVEQALLRENVAADGE